MKRIRITKEFGFEMAHALKHHKGPCRNIHGHSYRLSVTVLGSIVMDRQSSSQGMVMDFGDLKEIVNEKIINWMDHALVLNEEDAPGELKTQAAMFGKLVTVDYQPTCENLLLDFAMKLHEGLPKNVKLMHMMLRETPSSYSEWYAEDNEPLN
jgi:6-pyruvoyltetrahydropterin/6-carboxytetrahydropterin synthase